MYQSYVVPFREAGGMPLKAKLKMLAISNTMLIISAALVRKPMVWIILACVSAFLLYLVCIRIPTVDASTVAARRDEGEEAACEG